MLDLIVKEKWFRARATVGFWPANAQGDDIVLYADESRTKSIATLHTLRQQLEKREGRSTRRSPTSLRRWTRGVPDYIGSFVVTAGIGEDVIADRSRWPMTIFLDPVQSAGRSFGRSLRRAHACPRAPRILAYAPDEALSTDELISKSIRASAPRPAIRAARSHREGKFEQPSASHAVGF